METRRYCTPIARSKTKETPQAYQGKGVSKLSKAHQPRAIGDFKLNYFSKPDHLAKFAKEAH